MNKLKKVLAALLVVPMICSTCFAAIYAYDAPKTVDFNVLMFENILNERRWVIETLVDGNYKNNPYTEVLPFATETSMMKDVLDNYKNDAAFRYLVDTMDTVDNAGNYVGMGVEEAIAVFAHLLGFMSDAELVRYVDESIKSVNDLKYESILNDVLMTDYTSSWGSTLFESNSTLEQYRQMSKTLSSLSKVQKALKDNSDVLSKGYFESAEAFTAYTDSFIDAYGDGLYEALTSVVDSDFINNNEALIKQILNISAMTFVLSAELETPKMRANATDTQLMSEIYAYYFAPEINDILKVAGKTLNFMSVALKYAQTLEALVSQNDSTVQVMHRMRSYTADDDLAITLMLYSEMVKNQATEQIYDYDFIIDYIDKNKTGWIGDAAIKGSGKFFDKLLTLQNGYFDVDLQVMTNATSQNLLKLGKCISLGVWLADKATNIKDTAKEVYVCKYVNKVLNTAINTYKGDYESYLNNKTDENAKKCIDDLEYIKKLRLYGEKHAYSSISAQTESIAGILMGSTDVLNNLEKRYQASIDSLLGCAVIPQRNMDYVVNSGETLTITPYQLYTGEMTLVGTYKNSAGKTIIFPEAQHILQSCITVNGGTIEMRGNSNTNIVMVVPSISCTGNSTINLYGSNLYVGKLVNTGTLNINYKNDNAKLTVIDALTNSQTLNVHGNGNTTDVYIFNNSKNTNIDNSVLNITGSINNSGSITGSVVITSNGINPYYNNSYIGNLTPEVSGTGTMTTLAFASNYKKGININGRQSISSSLSCGNTRLRTPENLIMTGYCVADKNTLNNNITFRDYTSPTPLTVEGIAYIENNVVFNHNINLNGGLNLTSLCKTLTVNGPLFVKGDMEYKAGEIIGTDWIKIQGDLTVSSLSAKISKLDFVGTLPQRVSVSSQLTVSELNNHNTSLNGVTFDSLVYVTDILHSGDTSAYKNGENIILTGDAELDGNIINGSISAKDWTVSDTTTITGQMFTSGSITLKEGKTLDVGSYNQSEGSLVLEKDAVINSASEMKLKAQTTLDENSVINVKGNSVINGAVTSNGSFVVDGDCEIKSPFAGGTLTVKGDMIASAALTPENLEFSSKIAQYFNNTYETTVDTLTIENTSSTGVTIRSLITINNTYNNKTSKVSGGKNLVIGTSDGSIIQDETNGDLSVKGTYTIPENETVVIKGSLYLDRNAKLIIPDGATLEIRNNLISSGSNITVSENAFLKINDCFNSSSDTIDIQGELCVKGDAQFSSSTVNAPGLMTISGDFVKSDGTWTDLNIQLDGKAAQKFATNSTLEIKNLTFNNTSSSGVIVDGNFTVTDFFTNNSKRIDGLDKITILGSYIGNNTVHGNFVVSGTQVVGTGENLTINGTLNLLSGAQIIISDGGVMTIERSVISKGAKITVEEGGQLIIEDYLNSSSDEFTINGTMLVKGDAKVSSATVNASGLITFKSDLEVSSGTWNSPNISFESKLPQVVFGSAFNVGNLTIDNKCKTGITFNEKVICSGELDTASSVITGIEKLTAKS